MGENTAEVSRGRHDPEFETFCSVSYANINKGRHPLSSQQTALGCNSDPPPQTSFVLTWGSTINHPI